MRVDVFRPEVAAGAHSPAPHQRHLTVPASDVGYLRKTHGARNVTVVRGTIADPLKPDGRLVILDPLARKTASRPRAAQTQNHVLRPDLATEELRQAGFEVLSRDDHFVDAPDSEGIQWLIVARPPR